MALAVSFLTFPLLFALKLFALSLAQPLHDRNQLATTTTTTTKYTKRSLLINRPTQRGFRLWLQVDFDKHRRPSHEGLVSFPLWRSSDRVFSPPKRRGERGEDRGQSPWSPNRPGVQGERDGQHIEREKTEKCEVRTHRQTRQSEVSGVRVPTHPCDTPRGTVRSLVPSS